MPYIKREIHPLVKLIKAHGYTGESLARVIGSSASTARRKMEDPGRFTVEDLEKLQRVGRIPITAIRMAL